MTPTKYQIEASKTLAGDYPNIMKRFTESSDVIDGFHGAIGICTEGGELLDAYKKNLFYGKPLDKANLLEECGDVLWYLNAVLKSQGFTFEQAMEVNVKKLQARYKKGTFTEEDAINRDLNKETEVLEEGANVN